MGPKSTKECVGNMVKVESKKGEVEYIVEAKGEDTERKIRIQK